MPRTYGCAVGRRKSDLNLKKYSNDFVRDNMLELDGVKYLDNCFKVYTKKGDEMRLDGKPVVESFSKATAKSTAATIKVYSSTESAPLTVLEDGCSLIGEVLMPIAKHLHSLKIEFSFSNTLISVYAYPDGKEAEKVECKVNYL